MTGRARTKDEGQGRRMKDEDKDEGGQRPAEVHDRAEPRALLQILYFKCT